MSRPPKWHSPTDSVRLPSHLIPRLTEIARLLDQPIPSSTEDADSSAFQEYCSFVQNLTPKLCTIASGSGPKRYLIDPEPITFDEFKQLQQIEANLLAAMEAQGVTRREDRLLVFAQLVEACGVPFEDGRRQKAYAP